MHRCIPGWWVSVALLYFRAQDTPSPPVGSAPTNAIAAIYTDSPPQIDGDLRDPAWQNVAPLIFVEHPLENGLSIARVKLLWDNSYLYAAFDIDDTQVEDAGFTPWDGDSVSLMIDTILRSD